MNCPRILPLIVLLAGACGTLGLDFTRAEEVEEFFEKRVRPVLVEHCYECHNAKSAGENGGLALDSSAGLEQGGERGPLLEAGEPKQSLIVQAIRYEHDDLEMPPSGKLEEPQIRVVTQWVQMGGDIPDYGDSEPTKEKPKSTKQGKDFWSFQALKAAPIKTRAASRWQRSVADTFVHGKLQGKELVPQAEAERHVILRRLCFDLTGLPPTPDRLQAFLADRRADAVERQVDQLLASPHYGERSARPWLDLARYTDKTASWLKSTGKAWLYRDWVIDAMNRDVPYDRFVRLQLAADLIPDTQPEELAALGFLGLSPTYWKELRLAPDVIKTVVAEEWDERIDAVCRTFLGLTAACARCHDHKFDPVTMDDYYALAGVFASTQLVDRPLLPAKQAEIAMVAKKQVEKLEAQLKGATKEKSAEIKQQMESIRAGTPGFDANWVHAVEESSIHVLPNGPDATKLEYRRGESRDLPLFRRGSPRNTGDVIPRGFFTVFTGTAGEQTSQRRGFRKGSGRAELAEALFAEAGPLTARVIANRVWEQHFGNGLVRTSSNFGAQGERPTHSELLDWLALRLVGRNWSVKSLRRDIVLSATYRQASQFNQHAQKRDPENRLLWRRDRKRLDVESWRDAMQFVAGNHDTRFGGPAIALGDANNRRRTIYGLIARRELEPMLRIFDFPEPTSHSPNRTPTTTPLQQLFVLNGPFVHQQAKALAARLMELPKGGSRIDSVYLRLFSRLPSDDELSVGLEFIESANSFAQTDVDRWSAYVHSLLGLNEFTFVD